MRAARIQAKFGRTLAAWRTMLGGFDDEAFDAPGADGGWTPGQISDHVCLVGGFFLDQIEALSRGEGERQGFQFAPALMCFFGSFPPVRFKVPPDLPEEWLRIGRPERLPRAQALESLDRLERRTRDLCGAVEAAPADRKTRHPAAGWLNAAHWYQLNEMHLRHHLRQLRRRKRGR